MSTRKAIFFYALMFTALAASILFNLSSKLCKKLVTFAVELLPPIEPIKFAKLDCKLLDNDELLEAAVVASAVTPAVPLIC